MEKTEQLKNYLKNIVNPILENLVSDLLGDQPSDVLSYIGKWVDKKKIAKKPVKSDSEDDEEFEDKDLPVKKANVRAAVSAEAYGQYNKKENFQARVVPKSDLQKQNILDRLSKSFLFQSLEQKEMEIVINAMEIKNYVPGDLVIQQGDDGDLLYIVNQGELDCYKKFGKDQPEKFLKTYHPGEAFGELSLLYNAPRAATIKAKTQSILFGLDRSTFNNIVKDAAVKRRERFEAIIARIEILKSMDPYERTQLCDGVQEVKVQNGEFVIREGEQGDKFYMIECGQLKALKGNQEVYQYKEGDYFGELALMKNVPRQASIQATTDCKLLWLDRETFGRLLGPLDEILKRNQDRYNKFK